MHSKLATVVLFGAACIAAPVSVMRAAPGPWMDPAHAEDYVFIGKDVWDASPGKKVAPGAAPALYQDSRAVKDAPGRFWMASMKPTKPTFAVEGMVYSIEGAPSLHPTLDGKPPGNYNEFHGFWIATDLRRVVWVEKGDFWRGVANWPGGTIENRKQVTKLGVFTGKSPMLWYGHLLFVDGQFDPKKPVVRIDLNTGETQEMETYHVFHPGMQNYAATAVAAGMIHPSGRCLFEVTPETVYTYDALTGKAGAIANIFKDNPKVTMPYAGPQVVSGSIPPVWIADDVVVCVNDQGVITKIDIGNQRMEILEALRLTKAPTGDEMVVAERIQMKGVVPGGRFFDFLGTVPAPNTDPRWAFKERFLFDVETGKEVPTAMGEEANNGTWIDNRHFIYTRRTGGLAGVGTWVYDREKNAVTRIAPGQLETTRMAVLRGRDEVWAVNTAGGVTLMRAKLDGSGAEDLGACMMAQPMQFPAGPPLDLGFAPDSADPWAKQSD